MIQDAKKRLTLWMMKNPPWTNVYGLARSLIALGTLADIAVQSGICLLQNAKSNAQLFRHVQPVSAVSRFPLH
nr:hypothetical protein [Bacillus velezensis]